jgi:hypothetical protein
MSYGKNRRCFSRSGWWQTLCGRDSANQGFGWTDKSKWVGCADCKSAMRAHLHHTRKSAHILVPAFQVDMVRLIAAETKRGER